MAPSSRLKVSAKEEKKTDDGVETVTGPVYSAENVQHNMRIIYYSRTFLSIVGGVIAGILGLSALSGFLLYFLIMLLVAGAIAAKTKFDVFSYFDSWKRITIDGITAGFMDLLLLVKFLGMRLCSYLIGLAREFCQVLDSKAYTPKLHVTLVDKRDHGGIRLSCAPKFRCVLHGPKDLQS